MLLSDHALAAIVVFSLWRRDQWLVLLHTVPAAVLLVDFDTNFNTADACVFVTDAVPLHATEILANRRVVVFESRLLVAICVERLNEVLAVGACRHDSTLVNLPARKNHL